MLRAVQFAVVCAVVAIASVRQVHAAPLLIAGSGTLSTESGPDSDSLNGKIITFSATIDDGETWQVWSENSSWHVAPYSSISFTFDGNAITGDNGPYSQHVNSSGNGYGVIRLSNGSFPTVSVLGDTSVVIQSLFQSSPSGQPAAGSLVVAGDLFQDFSSYANRIVGINGSNYTISGGSLSITSAATVPEPTSLALLGMGAIGLVGYRRRKRKLAA